MVEFIVNYSAIQLPSSSLIASMFIFVLIEEVADGLRARIRTNGTLYDLSVIEDANKDKPQKKSKGL